MIDLNELQRLAEEATPGRWHLIRAGLRDGAALATIEPAPETMTEPNYWTVASVNTLRDEWATNARFIAAMHPDTAKKLIAVALAAQNAIGWFPGPAAWHTEAPTKDIAALRTAIEELK